MSRPPRLTCLQDSEGSATGPLPRLKAPWGGPVHSRILEPLTVRVLEAPPLLLSPSSRPLETPHVPTNGSLIVNVRRHLRPSTPPPCLLSGPLPPSLPHCQGRRDPTSAKSREAPDPITTLQALREVPCPSLSLDCPHPSLHLLGTALPQTFSVTTRFQRAFPSYAWLLFSPPETPPRFCPGPHVVTPRSHLAVLSQSCPPLCSFMDCSPSGSSVPGIFQARILEWVAISFSRGSSRPRD